MRTSDAEVTVEAWATYWYIKDVNTGRMWSRNRWGSNTAVPDLYATKRAAERSTNNSKVNLSRAQGFQPIVCSCLFGYESSGIKTITT